MQPAQTTKAVLDLGLEELVDLEILIVDDNPADAAAVAEILSELANVRPVTATDPEQAVTLVERNPGRFALVLQDLNLNLKNLDGVGLAKRIWKINPSQLIAIFSGEENVDALIKCVGTPVVEFIKKGGPATLTQKKVSNLLQKYRSTHPTIEVSKASLEHQRICEAIGLVSRSPLMASVANDLKKIALSDATVLIHGESGTGKELIARATHKLSARKNGPFVGLNMTALSSTLIESELFGHEKGSFTGATSSRQGAFVRANGGTLFMDEIGDLPPNLQVKLLRVIQEREVQTVGGNRPIKIDVRIIAATHEDLKARISQGLFRLDLFQRLNVLIVNLPKLSVRTEDIQPLTEHFLKKLGSNKKFDKDALLQLEKYGWPGNVRELENLVERVCVLTDDSIIKPEHLPSEVFAEEVKVDSSPASFDHDVTHAELLQKLNAIEREYLIFNLSKAKSIRDAALNRMRMSPSTLRDRMDFHNVTYKPTTTDISGEKGKGENNEAAV